MSRKRQKHRVSQASILVIDPKGQETFEQVGRLLDGVGIKYIVLAEVMLIDAGELADPEAGS